MFKKFCIVAGWILIGLMILVGLFYAEENWRGKHAWETYKRQGEAKGDSFEWPSLVPPPVPDDQNFAATPLFAELFPKPTEHPRLESIALPRCANSPGNWHEGRIEDLAVWRECFTNTDLLAALSRYDPVLRDIAEANRRPECRFPIQYEDSYKVLLPHLTPLRNLARVYRLRALAELSAGQANAAFDDVQTCLRLADRIKGEPLFISFLVRRAMIDLATQPVWEGLIRHQWNEAQLAALQAGFEKVDLFENFARAVHGARLYVSGTISRLMNEPSEGPELFVNSPQAVFLFHAAPKGWFYQNGLTLDRFYTEAYLNGVDWEHRQINPHTIEHIQHPFDAMRNTPYNVLSKLLAGSVPAVTTKAALAVASVDEATMACALERYRLTYGRFPENLDALVPQFIAKLPNDVINGQQFHYRPTLDGQYLLYSVGWNESDDGAQIAFTRSGDPPSQYLDKGDWVWFSQPQPQPSASERK